MLETGFRKDVTAPALKIWRIQMNYEMHNQYAHYYFDFNGAVNIYFSP
jgi:hypothetical protein